MKKWKGKPHYFGVWSDPAAALDRWRDEWPKITRGETAARIKPGGRATVLAVCTDFILAKEAAVARGDIVVRTLDAYRWTCRKLSKRWAKRHVASLSPQDFAELLAAQKLGPIGRGNFVVYVRMVFTWAKEAKLIAAPVDFGPDFVGPPAKVKRRLKREQGNRQWEAAFIRKLIARAIPMMKAAIYLSLNGGYEPAAMSDLRVGVIDLDRALIDYTRLKTEAKRVVPLWPETVKAIRKVIVKGQTHIFVNTNGTPLTHGNTHGLATRMRRLLGECKAWKHGMGFYDLRRTFATVAAEVNDREASKIIMGHVLTDVHDGYIQKFPMSRLVAVTDHVRKWLLAK